jgi:glyoxylase-like metal-dependent hydrolase (beta-lactamase superfamily II)
LRGALLLAAFVVDLGAAAAAQHTTFDDVTVHSIKVGGNVYMLVGAGSNVAVQIGEDGVLVVDSEFDQMVDKLVAEIRRLAGNKPIRYIINTHGHPDHVGGNARLKAAGEAIIAGNVARDVGGDRATGAAIIAHENVLTKMSAPTGQQSPVPAAAWPTDTFFTREMDFTFNNEAVQLFHEAAAHTDGDVMVLFRRSDVLATGDVFVTTSYPVIDLRNGGSLNGIVDGLNHIIEITVPHDKQEGGTMVIPGHGRVCDEADVVEYRDMVTIIRDRIRRMIQNGMTLEEVKAARPTRDYDARYGATSGDWTTEMFLEAAYRSLAQTPKPETK